MLSTVWSLPGSRWKGKKTAGKLPLRLHWHAMGKEWLQECFLVAEGGWTPTAWTQAGHRLPDGASRPWNTMRHTENTWAGPLRCSSSAKGPGTAAGSQQSCREPRMDWSAGECSKLLPPDFSELRFAAQPTGRVLDCSPTAKPRITTSSCFLPFNFSENCPTYSTN